MAGHAIEPDRGPRHEPTGLTAESGVVAGAAMDPNRSSQSGSVRES
jgi:hypothetical protein